MDSYELTGDGVPNLILGRQDGSIEVYNVNILDENDTPVLIFTHVIVYTILFLSCIQFK